MSTSLTRESGGLSDADTINNSSDTARRAWLDQQECIAGINVGELRTLYSFRLKRAAEFPTQKDEYTALHAIAMMQKAHYDDLDD